MVHLDILGGVEADTVVALRVAGTLMTDTVGCLLVGTRPPTHRAIRMIDMVRLLVVDLSLLLRCVETPTIDTRAVHLLRVTMRHASATILVHRPVVVPEWTTHLATLLLVALLTTRLLVDTATCRLRLLVAQGTTISRLPRRVQQGPAQGTMPPRAPATTMLAPQYVATSPPPVHSLSAVSPCIIDRKSVV